MAKTTQDKFVSVTNDTLTLIKGGNYTIDFTGGAVVINRGGSTTLSDAQFAAVTTFDFGSVNKLNLVGIGFTEANVATNGKFEPDANLDKLIGSLLSQYGVEGTLDMLTVNGGTADVFKLIWDYVDDNYAYYNTGINAVAVELGLAYADYLLEGGAPLTDVVAKYAADGGDAGTAPDRLQSLHDNILGNLHVNSIIDKFFDGDASNGAPELPEAGYATGGSNANANEALGQALLDRIFAADLDGRPVYSGSETADPVPTQQWDVDHFLL